MENSEPLSVVYPRCCGLDVHKRQVQACVLLSTSTGNVAQEQRSFGTTTEDLLALLDWLREAGCTHVAMEATGSYWKPIHNLLDGQVEILVVNAAHIKQVPGRKTDVRDAAWLAGLLRHGLLQPSFIPDRPQRELRDLTRYRMSLINERSTEANRLQKVLEDANLKPASIASNMLGKSGREMLDRIVAGETDAVRLAQCARGRMKAKIPQLEAALAGTVTEHHRWLLGQQLSHIDDLDARIAALSERIGQLLAPFVAELDLLDTIPGVGRNTAEVIVAEVGTDMKPVPGRGPSRVVGRHGSRQPGERGQAQEREDAQRQSLVAHQLGGCRTVGWPEQGNYPERALPCHRRSSRHETRCRRGRPFDTARRLPHPERTPAL